MFFLPPRGLGVDEAIACAVDSESHFAGLGARTEFCRSKGVDYENTLRYGELIKRWASPHHSAAAAEEPPSPPIPKREPQRLLVIQVPGSSARLAMFIRGCPICIDRSHGLDTCRHLPADVRVFFSG